MKKGQFQIYTGNGKGKTTAALGLALRASGAGYRVYFCQFIKDREYSEIKSLRLLPNVDIEQFGTGKGILVNREKEEADLECARVGYEKLLDTLKSGVYDVVIADEINCALMCGLLSESQLLDLADRRPDTCELVFTGRGATQPLMDRADLVTEMRPIKHYYETKHLPARPGIEL
jgi:cob(I)alamin adenosyltransferase